MKQFAPETAKNLEAEETAAKSDVQAKHAYSTPELKEHGSAQEVTLQTFFGTFSPPTGTFEPS